MLRPAVGESLQPAALQRRQPAHEVFFRRRGDRARPLGDQRGGDFCPHAQAVLSVLAGCEAGAVKAVGWQADQQRILAVARHERGRLFLLRLGIDHRADAVSGRYHHHAALIAAGVAAALVERPAGRGFVKPALRVWGEHSFARRGAYAEGFRREQRLVVVAAQRRRQVVLNKRALAAAITARAYFQRQRRFSHGDTRRFPAAQRGRFFFLIAYSTAGLSAFIAEACRSSAILSTSGSSFPRFCARRSIPRQAFGLKQYFSGASACKIEDNKYTFPSLCDAPPLRGVEDAPGESITVAHDLPGRQPASSRRQRNICFGFLDADEAFEDLPEVLPIVRGQRARHVLPHSPFGIFSIRCLPHFPDDADCLEKQAGSSAGQSFPLACYGNVLTGRAKGDHVHGFKFRAVQAMNISVVLHLRQPLFCHPYRERLDLRRPHGAYARILPRKREAPDAVKQAAQRQWFRRFLHLLPLLTLFPPPVLPRSAPPAPAARPALQG